MCPSPQLLHQQLRVEVMTTAHPAIVEIRTFDWPDEAACAAFAAGLARRSALHDAVIELRGDLGAGKTTFVRHLLRALGVGGRIKSPSYALLEPYEAGGIEISHFDFYRFDDPHEWVDAGLRDVFARPGLKLVEWPQKASGMLPPPDLRLTIEIRGEHARHVTAQAFSARGAELLA